MLIHITGSKDLFTVTFRMSVHLIIIPVCVLAVTKNIQDINEIFYSALKYIFLIKIETHAVLYNHSSTDTTSELQAAPLPSQLPRLLVTQYPDPTLEAFKTCPAAFLCNII